MTSSGEGPGGLLFVFLDGVGLGAAGAHNPFTEAQTPFLRELLGGVLIEDLEGVRQDTLLFSSLDATLNVPGLPQSATGQTTLLTGKNGAALMNRHYGPYPGPTLKRVLDEGTLFSEVRAAGGRAVLANVFPRPYHQALAASTLKVNVPVYAALAAGLPLLTEEDYALGRALSADLTGAYLHEGDPTLPLRVPQEAGKTLAHVAAEHTFTFFDFWLSDRAGHRGSFAQAVALVEGLDAFFAGLVPALGKTTLLVTSDHGNLEDKRTKSHTLNPVPLLAVGPSATHFAGLKDLLGVAPAVRRALRLRDPLAASAG